MKYIVVDCDVSNVVLVYLHDFHIYLITICRLPSNNVSDPHLETSSSSLSSPATSESEMTGAGTEVTQRVTNLESRKPAKASAPPVWLPAAESRVTAWTGQTVAYKLELMTLFQKKINNNK